MFTLIIIAWIMSTLHAPTILWLMWTVAFIWKIIMYIISLLSSD